MSTSKYAISDENKELVANSMKKLLADSYTLYLQSHNFHWNVVGPRFRDLHLMFEEHYTELATAVDEIAERIRTLNSPAPGTYKEFAQLSSIKETEGVPSAEEMIQILADSHQQVIYTCREVMEKAEQAGDESSAALASDRMRIHEKTSWMLRSLLA